MVALAVRRDLTRVRRCALRVMVHVPRLAPMTGRPGLVRRFLFFLLPCHGRSTLARALRL